MSYRIAHSLDRLRNQINEQSPNRNKASDGWIGDAAHKTRDSDHNPWVRIQSGKERGMGVVTALDITHDPAHGVVCGMIAEQLVASKDKRIKYLIWNSRIISGAEGPRPWQWRKYGGANPHNRHMHISVEDSDGNPKGLFDQDEAWAVKLSEDVNEPPAPPSRPTIKRGDKGEEVAVLQRLLAADEYNIVVDGDFGPATEKAVRHFQISHGAKGDGIVGPYTWEILES